MNINYSVINSDERAIFNMRSLYKKYGYSQFKMSKFEEYDLYVRNKDYLVSENIIAFTDTDGKLMALKPDVTLSIIKNSDSKNKGVQKVFYDENVYRVSKSTHNFKEIMQVGLECIGDIDTYNIFEVIMLAAKSLEGISCDYVLDISNMDIISDLLDSSGLDGKRKKAVIKCIEEKNIHGIKEICIENNVDTVYCNKITKLVSLYGSNSEIISEIKKIAEPKSRDAVESLEMIMNLIEKSGFGEKVHIDFSVMNDSNYYNGFVFKGFIKGIASWILCGGQYDKLMKKMRSESGAVGFAVYLDMLERFEAESNQYDVDAVILYDEDYNIEKLCSVVNSFVEDGKSVIALRSAIGDTKCKAVYKLTESGVEIIENNA